MPLIFLIIAPIPKPINAVSAPPIIASMLKGLILLKEMLIIFARLNVAYCAREYAKPIKSEPIIPPLNEHPPAPKEIEHTRAETGSTT